jgi:hypothetical protein
MSGAPMKQEIIDKVLAHVKGVREHGASLSRFGFFNADTGDIYKTYDYICFATLKYGIRDRSFDEGKGDVPSNVKNLGFYSVYNGSSIKDIKKPHGGVELAYGRVKQRKKYTGDEYSLDWLEWLLSADSPYRDVFPNMVPLSNTTINDSGFLFTGIRNMPVKLLYNFLIASRQPYEHPEVYRIYRMLVSQGVSKNKAAFIGNGFTYSDLTKRFEQQSCDGHQIFSGATLGLYARFVNCLPHKDDYTDLTKEWSGSGKAQAIFDDNPRKDYWDAFTAILGEDDEMDLPELLAFLDKLEEKQMKVIKGKKNG